MPLRYMNNDRDCHSWTLINRKAACKDFCLNTGTRRSIPFGLKKAVPTSGTAPRENKITERYMPMIW